MVWVGWSGAGRAGEVEGGGRGEIRKKARATRGSSASFIERNELKHVYLLIQLTAQYFLNLINLSSLE